MRRIQGLSKKVKTRKAQPPDCAPVGEQYIAIERSVNRRQWALELAGEDNKQLETREESRSCENRLVIPASDGLPQQGSCMR